MELELSNTGSSENGSIKMDDQTSGTPSCPNCPTDVKTCSSCRKLQLRHQLLCLRRDLEWNQRYYVPGEYAEAITLGEITEPSKHPECPFCRFLAHVKSRYLETTLLDDYKRSRRSREWSFEINDGWCKSLGCGKTDEIVKSAEGWWYLDVHTFERLIDYSGFLNMRPRLKEDSGKLRPPARKVGPYVNWDLIKTYAQSCEKNHSKGCKSLTGPDHLRKPCRVIDVNNQCLVNTPSHALYLTLSYVWGRLQLGMDMPMAMTSNISNLQIKGALSKLRLPATISEAMYACRRLGHRYLWVDALCIVQDDNDELTDQIRHMYDIYSGSFMTIVAATGEHANSGLSGVGRNRPRTPQRGTQHEGMEIIEVLPFLSDVSHRWKWNTRGWTQQEKLLSRRCLFFTPFQAYLQCRETVYNEDLCVAEHGAEVRRVQRNMYSLRQTVKVWDDFKQQLEDYTKRDLSFQSDIFRAFSGIYKHIYGSVTDIFGLPETDFDRALVWSPALSCKRRVLDSASNFIIPSWSWASCEGAINCGDGSLTVKLVSWWVCMSENEGFRQIGVYNGEPQPLSCMDGGADLKAHTQRQSSTCVPKPGRLLFRTQSAFLNLTAGDSTNAKLEISPLSKTNKEKFNIGYIHVDPSWIAANMDRLNPSTAINDVGFEFVVIAGYSTMGISIPHHWNISHLDSYTSIFGRNNQANFYTDFEKARDVQKFLQIPARERHPDKWHSQGWNVKNTKVYVMLIEWRGDVARRLGVTYVSLTDWLENALKLKDIVLE